MKKKTTPQIGQAQSFDSVVIGSSPLMLLVAIELATKGHKVCIVERNMRLGGVWRSVSTESEFDVEIACHLIEDFPGVYDYLAKVTGIPFVVLDEQPVRVLKNGIRLRYSSRKMLIISVLRSSGVLLFYGALKLFQKQTTEQAEEAVMHKKKIADFWLYLWPILFKGSVVKAPKHGYAEFISALERRCSDLGVVIKSAEIDKIEKSSDGWTLVTRDGALLVARYVHCTSSAGFKKDGPDSYRCEKNGEMISCCRLIEISKSDVFKDLSYAAFWKDPDLVRIARVDQLYPRQDSKLYLVQTKRGIYSSIKNQENFIYKGLVRSKLIVDGTCVKHLDAIECKYTPHRGQIIGKKIDSDFFGYSSAGNLASGILSWLKGRGKL